MRPRLPLLLLLAGASLVAAQEPPRAEPAGADVPANAYALVADVAILRTAVEAEVARGAPARVALQRLVAMEVLRQNLAREGADPADLTEAELEAGVAEARAELVSRGATAEQAAELDAMREQLRVPVAFSRFVNARVTDDALRAAVEGRRLELAGEVRLRAISFRIDPARGGEAGARARATGIYAQLGQAPTDAAFAALARAASEEPAAALTGGDLDWQSPRAATVPLLFVRAALAHGQVGLLPEPIVTPRAVHVLWIAAVHVPATATAESMLPRLRAQERERVAAELMERWLQETPIRYAADAPR